MYSKEGYTQDFELATILTITTGTSFVGDFSKASELMYFIFGTRDIGPIAMGFMKDDAIDHIFTLYPALKKVKKPKDVTPNQFLIEQEQKFGTHLPITKLGYCLPKPKEENTVPETTGPQRRLRQNKTS